jgi:hypothetical protein
LQQEKKKEYSLNYYIKEQQKMNFYIQDDILQNQSIFEPSLYSRHQFNQQSKQSYIVPSSELDEIKLLFSTKDRVKLNDFQSLCLKLHPDLNSTTTITIQNKLEETFNDFDINGDGLIDFDGFLVAYAFARSSKF